MKDRILFIKLGGFSHVNRKVADILERNYPSAEVIVYDVLEDLFSNKLIYLTNLVYFFWEYRYDILARNKTPRELKSCLIITTYFFKKVKSRIEKKFFSQSISFSFQTQSQFDCSLNGIPHFIYTDHTLRANFLYPNINYRAYMKPNAYTLQLEKKVYDNADQILTYSAFAKQSLITQYEVDGNKVSVVGISPNVPNLTDSERMDRVGKTVLFVGVDWKRKGGDLLVEAFKKVVAEIPDAVLKIVGCSPQHISHPQIEVLGRVPLEKVSQYYREASVFCMPSLREPFGIVYLEAMTYKLPVIALRRGAAREIVDHKVTGYLSRGNSGDLSKYIISLLKDSDLSEKMGMKGYEKMANSYTDEIFEKNITSIIQKVAYFNMKKDVNNS